MSGEAYIEKIVQVPFELPIPDKTDLHSLFFNRLSVVLSGIEENSFDQQDWGNVFLDGIEQFIKTPRDISRLCNTLLITFPVVKNETYPVDFIAIETLRVFMPTLYDIIRSNPDQFTGYIGESYQQEEKTQLTNFLNSYIEKLTNFEKIKNLLQRLFPKLLSVWSNTIVGYHSFEQYRKQKRICCKENFPVYFRLSISAGNVSHRDIYHFISISNDKNEIIKYFRKK